MSREFIDAIASGNNLEAEDEFKNSISSKVGDALEFRRKEISQTFAGNNELVEEDSKPYVKQKPDGTWCVYDAEGNIVSEHESKDEAKAALSNKKEDDEESDLDEAGWVNLARELEPGGRLSKEKDTGKGWQNINKVLGKKDKDDGKGWQNLNKLLAKKPKKDGVPPTREIPAPRTTGKPKVKSGRRSPGALGGKRDDYYGL